MNKVQKPPKNMDPTVYGYLYQLAELLGVELERVETSVESSASAVKEMRAIAGTSRPTPFGDLDALRSLIIKTADTASLQKKIDELKETINGLSLMMSQDYVAVSDFGKYLETLNAEIALDPAAITQYYKFVSELQINVDKIASAVGDYRIETEGYIRSGIVYYEGGVPVYGVAVGQDLSVTEVDGETVIDQKDFRAIYTASKLSFWQDDREVAYISNNQLYITSITALQGVTIGKWDISASRGLAFKWIGG